MEKAERPREEAPMPIARRGLLAATAAGLTAPALAQPAPAWPERPVRVIVPYPAGSTPDIAARAVAQYLAQVFGQPFVADNRTGAGGNIGTEAVARATDGHTIGVSINGPLSTAKALFPSLAWDPQRDLTLVSLLVQAAQLLVVHPSVPAQDLVGFLAHVRANPGKMSFGSVGTGSGGHLAMEDLMARAGIRMEHVPYRGFPQATLDLVAGRIEAMFITAAGILPQIREGRVRALAVTAEKRIPQAPEVPTLAEGGVPDAASYAWVGLIAPAGMPAPVVKRLSEEAGRALAVPATKQALETLGFEVVGSSPEAFARFVASETTRWGGLIQKLGIRPDA
jgi:tripartite-type tricarboxylate transporter receptor subunit TctC